LYDGATLQLKRTQTYRKKWLLRKEGKFSR